MSLKYDRFIAESKLYLYFGEIIECAKYSVYFVINNIENTVCPWSPGRGISTKTFIHAYNVTVTMLVPYF